MGAALCRHQHPSLRLQRPFFSSSSLPLRLPHHLPYQSSNLYFNSSPLKPYIRFDSILTKREKSATKEAISIFGKYIECCGSSGSEENSGSKRRKLTEDVNDGGDVKEGACSAVKVDTDGETGPLLKLVKLTKSGLLLFIFGKNVFPDVLGIVSKVVQSVESGSSGSLLWCNRIFPIQATCNLNEKELREAVPKLVLQFMKDNPKLVQPIKFAIRYNRRGIETELNIPKESPNPLELLERNKCFTLVASAVKEVVSDSVVDLKAPECSTAHNYKHHEV